MKVLIWFACLFAYVSLDVVIKGCGIRLGAIPTILIFSATLWLARTLCGKWDDYKYKKDREKFLKDYKEPTPPPGVVTPVSKELDVHPEETEQIEPPRIKFCRKCGFELLDGSEFCSKCGTAIVKE